MPFVCFSFASSLVMSTHYPLPTRDGVSPSKVWLPQGQWNSLGAFFVARFPMVSAELWRDRMARREVVDQAGRAVDFDGPFQPGVCLFYYRERKHETPIPFEEIILFQNTQLLVVDKPHFLSVTPGGRFLRETLLARLKKKTGIETLTPIHRLDRETAGVMMFSVEPSTRSLWQSLFRLRQVTKVYEALASTLSSVSFPLELHSRIERDAQFFRMREVTGEANASTRIELISSDIGTGLSHYRLHPMTGKMHQLRVHMNSIGAPILNDGFYPLALPCKGDDFSAPLKLLARSIQFRDPWSGEERHFVSQRVL